MAKERVTAAGRDWIVTRGVTGRIVQVSPAAPEYWRYCLPEGHPDKLYPQMPPGIRGNKETFITSRRERKRY